MRGDALREVGLRVRRMRGRAARAQADRRLCLHLRPRRHVRRSLRLRERQPRRHPAYRSGTELRDTSPGQSRAADRLQPRASRERVHGSRRRLRHPRLDRRSTRASHRHRDLGVSDQVRGQPADEPAPRGVPALRQAHGKHVHGQVRLHQPEPRRRRPSDRSIELRRAGDPRTADSRPPFAPGSHGPPSPFDASR